MIAWSPSLEAVFQLRIILRVNLRPSGKAREVHLSLLPCSLQQLQVLKSSLGRESEHCPGPNETVDKNTNHEFPHKIVAI